ncbi:hypothetical protein QUC31_007615 [Theobroma cacao]|uniref:Uncharacterized protein LOC18604936 n=2 Tax=Theobroma cacao TaxID=3641 RepID=A0AB32VEK5_THECC|nr:PREDICTED: uncharacterized protein LOC18604936 [Theobroma cacao]EOY22211.1 Uncharacterized protein TCM_014436 [Theobroma cacao]
MEPSKILGGTEECHSSESGWTMYIGSPIQGGDDDDDDGHSDADAYAANYGGHADETEINHEADSDDSMASDASSGPSHQGHRYGNMEEGHGTSHLNDEVEGEGNYYLDKEAKKSLEKQKLGMKKKEDKEDQKERMTLKAKGAATPRSGSKVRKSIWLGKRK